ncbi:unnamed protein product, partial [Rotaria socialis]
MPSFSVLTNQFQFTIGTALTRMEIWATSWSERWIDRPPSSGRETEHFQMLAQFFDHYQSQ